MSFTISPEALKDVKNMFSLAFESEAIGNTGGMAYIIGQLLGGAGKILAVDHAVFGNSTNKAGIPYHALALKKYSASVQYAMPSREVIESEFPVPKSRVPLYPGSAIDAETGLIVASAGSWGLVDEALCVQAISRIKAWSDVADLNAQCAAAS
jgi:hypothetical protein